MFAAPEEAARALGRAAAYADWRRREVGTVPTFDDLDIDSAHAIVQAALDAWPDGGWLDAEDAAAVVDAFGIRVQPTTAPSGPGVDTVVGVVQDHSFGPLVTFGIAGITSDLLGDRGVRLVPVTDRDAADLVRSVKASPLLLGYEGSPPMDVDALGNLVLRVGRLADELPEVAELSLNPVVVTESGAAAAGIRLRVAPVGVLPDPYLRRLR